MKLKSLAIIALGLVSSTVAFSQEEQIDTLNVHEQRITSLEDYVLTSKKLKISGYMQVQWQSSQIDSLGKGSQDMKVGTAKSGSETDNMNRFGIRRGRIKMAYEDFGCTGVLQFDLTEKGMALKDAYLNILDPWVGYLSLKTGVFDRPFGYEISYSSSRRESPERSRIFQTLFPDERDLGAMLVLQAPKTSPWNVLKLEAGLFSGNGIYQDNDSKKDFIGHLTYNKQLAANMKLGLGASFYDGSVIQTNANVYTVNNGAFVLNSNPTNKNSFAKRQYFGLDGQFVLSSALGLTTIKGEYIYGDQPANGSTSSSPKSGNISGVDNLNATLGGTDTYIRKMSGGYVHFIQDIADTKHSIVVKYDWYDPNTNIAGDKIGVAAKTGKADVAYSTLGFGYMYRMNNNIRIMAYYDMVSNEKVSLKGYLAKQDLADNLVTVRLQYKF
jgi:phosphate-selective porin